MVVATERGFDSVMDGMEDFSKGSVDGSEVEAMRRKRRVSVPE